MNDSELLKSRFSNIFIKLIIGIMTNELKDVRHFLSDELYNRMQTMINENVSNHEIRCFDEPNVKEVNIVETGSDEKYDFVYVDLVSRYMDYYIDSDTKNYKRGTNDHRIELSHRMLFKKLKGVSVNNTVVKCPSCGANLDPNNSGYCKYCGKTNSAESYDYVLYEVSNL